MKCPEDIKTYSNLRPKQKLFQYLNALDQKYEPVKREILRLEPLPSAKAAYAVVRKEAAHQNILGETSNDTHGIAGDLVATETKGLWLVTNGHRRFEGKRNGPSGKEDKTKLKYGNCGKTRHTKEQCFEIIGYPDWWNDGHKKETKNLGPERGKASAANIGTDRKNPIGFEGMTATRGERECIDTLSWLRYVTYEEGRNHCIKNESLFSIQLEDLNISVAQEAPNLIPERKLRVPPKRYSPKKESIGSRYPMANIAKGNLSEEAKALALSMYSDEILSNTEQALKSKHWKDAMEEEMKALTKNNT
nr:putative Gag-polypeptide of LTR copia-type [Tanacetum cinerariifolium]